MQTQIADLFEKIGQNYNIRIIVVVTLVSRSKNKYYLLLLGISMDSLFLWKLKKEGYEISFNPRISIICFC